MAKGIKTGGRKEGTQNRLTSEMRSVLKGIIDHELDHLPDHLDKLDDKQRLEFVLRLLPFVLPKVEVISHTTGERWDQYM
jgi:hypothetical protein